MAACYDVYEITGIVRPTANLQSANSANAGIEMNVEIADSLSMRWTATSWTSKTS